MIEEYANKMRSRVRARYHATPMPEFMAWWGRELGGLIPERLRHRMMPPKPQLWVVPADTGGGDLRIWRVGDAPRVVDVFGAGEDLELLRGRWRDILAEFEDGKPEIRLCLNEGQVLGLPLELPAAVESNLAQALRFQIDQISPFTADQVYYDHAVAAHDTERARIHVALRLVPRETLDPLLARLQAIGITTHAVDTLAEGEEVRPEGFNLLPAERRAHYVHARARFNALLAVGLVVVIGLVMAQSLILRERSLAGLNEEADRLRSEAREVMELQQRLEESLLAANFLAERRDQQPPSIRLLAELTRLLPDDIWLQRFQVQGEELTVQGLTDGSQRVIGLLNESELLEDAEFRGQTTMDPRTGRERFTTTARVEIDRDDAPLDPEQTSSEPLVEPLPEPLPDDRS